MRLPVVRSSTSIHIGSRFAYCVLQRPVAPGVARHAGRRERGAFAPGIGGKRRTHDGHTIMDTLDLSGFDAEVFSTSCPYGVPVVLYLRGRQLDSEFLACLSVRSPPERFGGRPGSGPVLRAFFPPSRAFSSTADGAFVHARGLGNVMSASRCLLQLEGSDASVFVLVQRQPSFYGLNTRSQNSQITARHFERSREISLKWAASAHGGSSTSLGATCHGILRSLQSLKNEP